MGRVALIPRRSALLGVALFLLAVPASADDSPHARYSLKGLKAVHVVVEDLRPDAEMDGLAKSELQRDVEVRLRQAGIRLDPSSPESLYVKLSTYKHESGLYSFSLTLEFHQPVRLYRDPKILQPFASTWSVGGAGIVDMVDIRNLRNHLADYVDYFISAYIEQNPKP